MRMSEFKYNLPREKIAQFPPKTRGSSKLLLLDRESGKIEDKRYYDIPNYISKGDIVVLNETKVLNSRTYFLTPNGKKVEVLFLENINEKEWFVLIGKAKFVKKGDLLKNEDNKDFEIEVKDRKENGFEVLFNKGMSDELFEKCGHTPLPPYMKRDDVEEDKVRYNTVFSEIPGAVAAPTASLNLTEDILKNIEKKGGELVKVELKIGWGTFAHVREDNVEDHKIHEEYISISKGVVSKINDAILRGKRVWAFGTTVVRTLESANYFDKENGRYLLKPFIGKTDLYIYPGYNWKIVDVLVTNFHMPDSSLILLVSSFAGKENVKMAYDHALQNSYKFLSYGDSMLIGDNLIK
jgi:S-adenosylmethionine:tRNA ribosyltransferase-isomerase